MQAPLEGAVRILPPEIDSKNIKKMYLAKFGNLYILPEKNFRTDKNLLLKTIIECLNSSPLVTSTERVIAPHQSKELAYTEKYTKEIPNDILEGIYFSPYVLCNICYPVKNQEEVEMDGSRASASNIDTTEEFNFIYNGSIYVIFREADPSKPIHPGVLDIRDFISDVFGNQRKAWKTKEEAPNPLRQDMFFLFLAENPETVSLVGRSFLNERYNRLYVCLPESDLKRFKQFMAICMYRVSVDLDTYYSAFSIYQGVEKIDERLELNQRSLKKMGDEIQKLSFFNFYEHYKKTKELEKLVATHFSNLVDYTITCKRLEREREHARLMIHQNELLRYFEKELIDEIRPEETDTETLTICANYLNELTQRSYTNKISILAVLLTIIGSVAGSVAIEYIRSILH